jgi:hypothetical protein
LAKNSDFDFDFGFSAMSEEDIPTAPNLDKLYGLRDMIMPLLNNLKKNPEKDYINWPNRVEKIDAFIKKMNDYIEK